MKNNIFYRVLSYVWRNTILKWYRNYKHNQLEKYWSEHTVRNGKENLNKTFYVIRRRDYYCGMFSLVLTNLVRIDEAIKKGFIPIVDMQNDFNIYLAQDKIGKENSWEYFFEQPAGYSLEDISRSKNVIIGSGAVPHMFPYLDVKFLLGETGELEYWRKLVKKYIVLNDKAKEYVDAEYSRLFTKEDKVLGVLCRGTDYVQGKPKNHPIQPTPIQAIEKTKEIFVEQKCSKIFLATEDALVFEAFKNEFGDKLITNKNEFIAYQGGSIGKERYNLGGGTVQSGMEYLATIMLLARCSCLCAGCVSGTVGALLFTKGYEYIYLFDLGIY